jgi:oligopeptide transport system permease protein
MSATTNLNDSGLGATTAAEQFSYWQDVRKRFFRNKIAVLGLTMLTAAVLVAVFGPLFTKGDYESARNIPDLPRRMFNEAGVFGTDQLGRNLWHRCIRGIGISLRLATAVAFISTVIGMVFGGLAGYLGGFVDSVISRAIEMIYAIPYVLIGIAAIAIFGPSFWTVMGTLVLTGWVGTARLFRSSVLQIRSQDYIEAARATGASTKRILLTHVLPNALPPIIVSIAFAISGAILSESIYSFLGIGFIEPTPALGVMIRNARTQFQPYPHLLWVPASILIWLTLSIVFIGDGLRDALDPKMRGVD